MYCILFYEFIDNFTEKRAPFREAHRRHVHQAYERGEILLAGPLAEPTDGGILIFKESSGSAAEEFAKTDPYVMNGLVKTWKVRKWKLVVGEGNQHE